MEPECAPFRSAPGLACGSPLREGEGTPHPLLTRLTAALLLRLAIPETCPPGEGKGC